MEHRHWCEHCHKYHDLMHECGEVKESKHNPFHKTDALERELKRKLHRGF